MAVLLGVCNWVHPLLQSPSCCKELKEAGIDAIQLDLGSAEEDFPLSSPGIQRQWKEEAELYGIRLDAVAVLAVLKHGRTICVRRPAVCGWPARWRNTGALL